MVKWHQELSHLRQGFQTCHSCISSPLEGATSRAGVTSQVFPGEVTPKGCGHFSGDVYACYCLTLGGREEWHSLPQAGLDRAPCAAATGVTAVD